MWRFSIEASLLLGAGRILAVEQDAQRVAQIRHNVRQYGVCNHEVLQANLPEGLKALPHPDHIFIGGGGRRLVDILQTATGYLKPGGVVVVNTVLADNLTRAVDALTSLDMDAETVQVQVNRSKAMPWSRRLEAPNPVWIISAQRKADQT